MRRAYLVILATVLATGCIVSAGDKPATGSPSAHAAWEYTQDVVCVPGYLPVTQHQAQLASILEQRGRGGWELISASPSASGSETCYLLIFKRETAG
jgi:hypothetical protein